MPTARSTSRSSTSRRRVTKNASATTASAPVSVRANTATPSSVHHRRRNTHRVPLAVITVAFLSVVALTIGAFAAESMRRSDVYREQAQMQAFSSLMVRIEALEQKVGGTSASTTTPAATTTPATQESQDEQTVSGSQVLQLQGQAALTDWNSAAANQVVEYRDTKRGIRFNVPFNPAWGNEQYRLAAYDVSEDGSSISFGPVSEQTNWYRPYTLSVLATRTPEAALAELRERAGAEATVSNPTTVRLPNYSVTKYEATNTEGDFDNVGWLEFPGRKYNYTFSGFGSTSPAPETYSVFSNLLSTLRSI